MPVSQSKSGRRRFLFSGIAAFVGGIFGSRAAAAEQPEAGPLVTEGQTLKAGVYKGRPPLEPLDTMVRFERSDDSSGRPITHEVLSLIHEEKGQNSYPWTIYAHLTTHHTGGDACVMCSRLTKMGPGWSTGLHSEVFNHGRAVALGANIEMTNNYTGDEGCTVIGLNIQMLPGQPSQYGIQVHGQGAVEKSIGLNGTGQVGLDLGGKFETGINTHSNSIRLDEGTCIELDGAGKVRIRYAKGRIEFLNGDKCVGHISVDGDDHVM